MVEGTEEATKIWFSISIWILNCIPDYVSSSDIRVEFEGARKSHQSAVEVQPVAAKVAEDCCNINRNSPDLAAQHGQLS